MEQKKRKHGDTDEGTAHMDVSVLKELGLPFPKGSSLGEHEFNQLLIGELRRLAELRELSLTSLLVQQIRGLRSDFGGTEEIY